MKVLIDTFTTGEYEIDTYGVSSVRLVPDDFTLEDLEKIHQLFYSIVQDIWPRYKGKQGALKKKNEIGLKVFDAWNKFLDNFGMERIEFIENNL